MMDTTLMGQGLLTLQKEIINFYDHTHTNLIPIQTENI